MFCNYTYNNLTIRVNSSESSQQTWLQEFFCPHFAISTEGDYDCQVTLIEDTLQYEQMLHQGSYQNEEVDCFVMDTKVIRLPRWHSDLQEIVLFEAEFNTFYLVNPDQTEIYLLTPENNLKVRMCLLRVIRELTMNQSISNGGLFVHGAAFTIGDKGVIIAGPKGAGKTTLLLNALRDKKTNYLSSDRVFVSFQNRGVIFRGMPTIPSILPSTLEMFPTFRDHLLSSYFQYLLTIEEAKKLAIPYRPKENEKFGLTPAQFCNLLDLSPVAEAQGLALVFPKVTHSRGKIELQQLSEQESREKLSQSLFGGYHIEHQANIFALPNASGIVDQNKVSALCEQLISQVRCYECKVGTEAYQGIDTANNFLNFLIQ